MTSRAFLWLKPNGGAWSLASNWDDVTDGIDPSVLVPGAQDSVTIAGPAGTASETITGPGMAASALFTGNTTLSGSFGFGTLAVGGIASGGLLVVAPGAAIAAGSASLSAGSIVVNGAASALSVSGTFTLGTGQTGTGGTSCTLDATTGARVQAMALLLDGSAAHIYVDPSSIVEIGQAGVGAAGQLTVDPGTRTGGFGDFNGYGSVTNNGTIAATGGLLLLGATSGTGTLEIDDQAVLDLNGVCGAGQTVSFAGGLGTLAISTENDAPRGTVTGFAPGSAIDVLGSPISAALYAPTTGGDGLLTLTYGSQVAATITLAGDYSQDVFLTSGDGAGGTLITVAPGAGGGTRASGGTASPDVYVWVAPGSSKWNVAANWEDVTSGRNPASIAPGVNDVVTVAAPGSGFEVIAGPANAATFGVTGGLALSGLFDFGALTAGDAGTATPGTLDLLPGTVIDAGSATIADGAVAVSGAGTALAVSGTLAVGAGGATGVGLPTAGLSVTAGGAVQAAGLTLGGGSGASITTDPTATIEIGAAGDAQVGTVTVDAGASASGNGSINPYGAVIDNGSVTASGGTLTLGSVTGGGALAIAGGATLGLLASTALAITLTGAAATLAVGSERVAVTGVIGGFVTGDAIDVEGDQIDQAVYTASPSGGTGTLALFYGLTVVDRLVLSGSFTNRHFLTVPDGLGGTDILLSAYGGGGGGGGTGTDLLAWAQPVSGPWGTAHDWTDLTTGRVASAPPGSQNAVQIAGPAGTTFQTIGGPGTCASLAFTGNTLLSGAFSAPNLTIGQDPSGSLVASILELNSGSSLACAQGVLAAGDLIIANTGVTASVSGTLTLGPGLPDMAGLPAEASAQAHGSLLIGTLVLQGGGVDTDNAGSIEIGSLGGAAMGAVSVDAGAIATGYGSLNAVGTVIDNGSIEAAGGTLIVGSVSGAGMLSIGTEATLALGGTESCPIVFSGGGATLELAGSAQDPAATIAGFAAGDSIVTSGSMLSSAVWQPGAAGTGSLILLFGGQVAGTLSLAGDYSGDSFTVQPGDAGAVITVGPYDGSGPSPGTQAADFYVWTGASDTLWNDAGNWDDTSTGQEPAAIAPGQHDLVTIQGPAQGYQQVDGPGDAASLTLLGQVSLGGLYAIGSLAVGQGTATGVLALAEGATVNAAGAAVLGGIQLGGGTLAVGGGLALGGQAGGQASGVLAASSGSVVTAGSVRLGSSSSAIAVDGSSSVEFGGNQDGSFTQAVAGAVAIDAGGLLTGQGSVNLLGMTVDNGTIAALGGTLTLGDVSGDGTLTIETGAGLSLGGSVAAGLTIDFSAAGTLTLAEGMLAASIAGFAAGDEIVLPDAGATSATYAATGAGTGQLTVFAGNQAIDRLTLLGADATATYAVSAAPGGGTILTALAGSSGDGGGSMGTTSGSGPEDPSAFLASLPGYAQYWLQKSLTPEGYQLTPYVWESLDGSDFGAPILGFGYANVGLVTDPVAGSLVDIPAGYVALVAEGSTAIGLGDFVDRGLSDPGVTLVGNLGDDTIVGGDNDTLVGGLGANTVFAVDTTVTIQGGGNDLYNTGIGNVTIITSAGASLVGLGPAQNLVTTYGTDTIACLGASIAQDTVDASADTHQVVVFGPALGSLMVTGGAAPEIVVAGPGEVDMTGGSGGNAFDPNELWCTSGFASFVGGTGASAVIGGSGLLQVQGGAGPVTVYGGSGQAHITGSAGGSVFVVGLGATTVTAAAGNGVYAVGSAGISVAGAGNGVFVFAAASSGNDTLQSGAGFETMVGGAGNDLFEIGNGQGLFQGLGGADSFDFTNGVSGGSATIYDFTPGQDHIGLAGYSGGAAAVLATQIVTGGNTLLTLQDGTQVTLLGVSGLAASNFTVT